VRRLTVLLVSLSLCVAGAARGEALGRAATSAGPARPMGEPDSTPAGFLALANEVERLLTEGSGAAAGERHARLVEAAAQLETLAESSLLDPPLQSELRTAARELRDLGPPGPSEAWAFDPSPYVELLDRARARVGGGLALGLGFQGSYSQTKVQEPVYGGHATSMGPPPTPPPPAEDEGDPSPAQFEEVARLPVRTWCGGRTKDHILESGGTGVALVDYDADGRLDIFLVNAFELTEEREPVPHSNALFRNLGHWQFEDVSHQAGVDTTGWGSGVCAGDVNGDGSLDLYVTQFGNNLLFRNKGDGTFEEVGAAAGLQAPGWSTGCAFLDADGDGDLDLYVARYVETTWEELRHAERTYVWRDGPRVLLGPAGLPGEADLFFENRGDGTFFEATDAHGLTDSARAYGFGVVATDFDDDGWPDIFVANDSNPNFLYRNRGDGTFESVGLLGGVAVNAEARAQAGMGVDAGDYDGDGQIDFVLTTFAHDTKTIYRNLDGSQFEDASVRSGLTAATFVPMGWGAAFLDADLDGRLDLFLANGHIFPNVDDYPELRESFRQRNQLFLNEGDATFRDVSDIAGGGLQVQKSSRGLAVGDLDNDGDLDVVVTNMDDVPTLLENRQRTAHHWVAFRVRSPGPNPFAIGARVTLEAGGRRQVREIRSGGGYVSQSDLRASFGLGSYSGPVDVEIQMPGGRRWRWEALGTDRLHVLPLGDAASVAPAKAGPLRARVAGGDRDPSHQTLSEGDRDPSHQTLSESDKLEHDPSSQ
jgi:hypothetical protein